MDYYQGVVVEYLRADRSVFVNTECCIQLNPGDASGIHWYCDAVAADFRHKTFYLCEVSYAKSPGALLRRLASWNDHWPQIKAALARDSSLPEDWSVRPWVFAPEACIPKIVDSINRIGKGNGKTRQMPDPLITTLEMAAPWVYKRTWDRHGELEKPNTIPETMKV